MIEEYVLRVLDGTEWYCTGIRLEHNSGDFVPAQQ